MALSSDKWSLVVAAVGAESAVEFLLRTSLRPYRAFVRRPEPAELPQSALADAPSHVVALPFAVRPLVLARP